ncbi:ABC transporter substrate-binding protein [Paenibacillus ehimensis]|uniref:ABC transporter substrate-binding protein n=1 Tax=Paenibacillus ehimensis TaxID=79264 RepID=A0ABT8V5V3_9BACL|nr:ABC transporter substrate-binding protein [Paenibacillus ehimensis]MDO3676808.1 ABC transporter substrate-binding protein [Paenibacillus ehimensis]
MNKIAWLFLAAIFAACLASCSKTPEPAANMGQAAATAKDPASAAQANFYSFQDSTGEQVALPKKPERIVVLNTEVLELFYQLGGRAVGRATAPGIVLPEAAKDAKEVGDINNVSLEQIMSLKPDLVIGHPMFHTNLKSSMASAHIPLALIKIESYSDIQTAAKWVGNMTGNEAQSLAALQETDKKLQNIVAKLPGHGPNYAVITIMPMGVFVQKSSSIAIDMATMLKMKNVADGLPSGNMPSSAPYSLEKLVALDPDYIFLLVHGTQEFGNQKLKSDLENSPAWSSLRAVKEKKMFFLPSPLFVTNPGLHIDQSLETMAKLVYPDTFPAKE